MREWRGQRSIRRRSLAKRLVQGRGKAIGDGRPSGEAKTAARVEADGSGGAKKRWKGMNNQRGTGFYTSRKRRDGRAPRLAPTGRTHPDRAAACREAGKRASLAVRPFIIKSQSNSTSIFQLIIDCLFIETFFLFFLTQISHSRISFSLVISLDIESHRSQVCVS